MNSLHMQFIKILTYGNNPTRDYLETMCGLSHYSDTNEYE